MANGLNPTTVNGSTPTEPTVESLIPGKYVTVEKQRKTYYVFGVFVQIVKILVMSIFPYSAAEAWEIYQVSLIVDLIYCLLSIPLRLPCSYMPNKSKMTLLLCVFGLWVLDASVILASEHSKPHIQRVSNTRMKLALINPLRRSAESHINQGYHTNIHNSPYDTARLNPNAVPFCLQTDDHPVFIPISLEYCDLVGLKYSFTPPSQHHHRRRVEHQYLSARQLDAIRKQFTILYPNHCKNRCDNLVYIEIHNPGVIRLERILYFPNIDAHIFDPLDIIISPCPRARFTSLAPPTGDLRCQGCDAASSPLIVDAFGVPPMTLKWSRLFHETTTSRVIEDLIPNTPNTRRPNTAAYKGHSFRPDEAAQPHHVREILPLACGDIGDHIYLLDRIIDAFGNDIKLHNDLVSTEQISTTESIYPLTVLQKPTVSIQDCGRDRQQFVKQGHNRSLVLTTNSSDSRGHNFVDVTMRYRPLRSLYDDPRYIDTFPWERSFTIPGGESQLAIPSATPGDYAVVKINDRYCQGDVSQQDLCSIVEYPLPTADIQWRPWTDCYGIKGFSINMTLNGTAPFTVYYTLSSPGFIPYEFVKEFHTSRARFDLQPLRGGNYTVSILQISDANYANVSLAAAPMTQIVQDPISAKFLSGQLNPAANQMVLNTCDDAVDISIELQGLPPWVLTTQIISPSGTKYRPVRHIESSPHTFTLEVPFGVREPEGSFEVRIVSVEDSRGCKVDVSNVGLLINVKENKPIIKFSGEHVVDLIESKSAELVIELSGRAPWSVTYRREETSEKETVVLDVSTSRFHFPVTESGLYRIVGVENKDCPGTVLSTFSSVQVRAIPRPSLQLDYARGILYESSNSSHILHHSCQDASEHVFLDLTGRPPFQLAFNITERTLDGTKLAYNPTFYSSNNRYRLQLQTSNTGRMFYELVGIGDSLYPMEISQSTSQATTRRFTFEQHVFARPTAQFKSQTPLEQYLHSPFVSLDWSGSVSLTGVPPFQLQLSIRHISSGQVDLLSTDVKGNDWRINIPTYTFRTIGRHIIDIKSVMDASGCPHRARTSSLSSLFVDVYPSPILPPRKSHFCVGDVARFDLDGNPPWKINYRLNGQQHTQEVSCSPWNLPLDHPGELTITSIAHRNVQRPASLNLKYQVFARPSALVAYPNRINHDIPIGEQVYVNFTLLGTPPFTFSYQRVDMRGINRAEPSFNSLNKKYTVFDLNSNNHILDASYKDEWEVVEIIDKYCRSPGP